jgi:vitamin B12 transporter
LLSTAAALAAFPTLAQEIDPSAEVDAVVVTASRSGDAVPVDRTPASVTVFGAEILRTRQVREVSDVLRDSPGVAVSRVPGSTQVRLRGSEANHVLVLIDGIEASDPYAGEFDFGTLLADEPALIEVLRGQQSSLYGSDAIGGVIHYITATGAESPGVRARAEIGSHGSANAAARIGGVSGAFDYAGSATLLTTDGQPNARGGSRDLGSESAALSGKATWAPRENARVHGVLRHARTEADFNNADFSFPAGPTFGLVVDSPGSFFETEAAYGLVRGELDLLDGRWTHALEAQVADTRRDGFDFNAPSYGSEGRRTKASYVTTYRFGPARAAQRLTGAVDAERESFRNTGPFGFNGRREVENLGLVGQYELTLDDRLTAGASLRRDDNDLFDDATTYRLALGYRFDNGLRLRGAAGSGVKNPGFFELFGFIDGRYIGNPDLKPERSRGFELGAEQILAKAGITLGAVYFDNRLEDEVFVERPAPLFIDSPGNRDTESEQKGVEAYLNARFGRGWSVDAAYTALRAREDGQKEVRRADTIASLAVGWRDPGDRGSVTAVVRYNGAQDDLAFTDPSFAPVRVRLDPYTLVNLHGELALTNRLALFGRVENLLDQRYEEVFSFVAPGAAAFAGLRARF